MIPADLGGIVLAFLQQLYHLQLELPRIAPIMSHRAPPSLTSCSPHLPIIEASVSSVKMRGMAPLGSLEYPIVVISAVLKRKEAISESCYVTGSREASSVTRHKVVFASLRVHLRAC